MTLEILSLLTFLDCKEGKKLTANEMESISFFLSDLNIEYDLEDRDPIRLIKFLEALPNEEIVWAIDDFEEEV